MPKVAAASDFDVAFLFRLVLPNFLGEEKSLPSDDIWFLLTTTSRDGRRGRQGHLGELAAVGKEANEGGFLNLKASGWGVLLLPSKWKDAARAGRIPAGCIHSAPDTEPYRDKEKLGTKEGEDLSLSTWSSGEWS